MSFLYPAFLIGAAAIAIPVLLHLLRNEQAPELRFSAVRLLRDVKVEHAERRRIRDWLLLALRAAALLLLALAFARPYFGGSRVTGGAATVIVLDRSASMARGTAWHTALGIVREQLDRAPTGVAVGLIAFDDRADVIVEPTFDRGAIGAALGRLEAGIGGTRYQTAVARAVSLLDEVNASAGRVVLVSDLQGSAGDARVTVPSSIQVDVQPVAAPPDNLAVLAARRTSEGIVATLRNDGRSPVHTRVQVDVDGRRLGEAAVDLPPGELVDVPVRAAAARGTLRVHLAEADPGGLTADDSRYLQLEAGPRTRVLILAPPDDRFYLEAALRADESSQFDVTGATVQGLLPALAQQQPPEVLFLVGPRGLDRVGRDALMRYVRSGGRLFIGASEALNEPGFAPVLDGLSISAPHADDPVLALASFDGRHPVFSHLGSVADALGAARFTRAWRVRGEGWTALARFSDGDPALLERRMGEGRVLFFASDVNRGWNDLPLQSSFVPFVHEIARYLGPSHAPTELTPATLPEGVAPSLGLVRISATRSAIVNPDPRESDAARMTASQFSSMVRHRCERRLDAAAVRRRAEAAEEHQSLWRYGLMLMFATLVIEGLVGGRPRRMPGEHGGRSE